MNTHIPTYAGFDVHFKQTFSLFTSFASTLLLKFSMFYHVKHSSLAYSMLFFVSIFSASILFCVLNSMYSILATLIDRFLIHDVLFLFLILVLNYVHVFVMKHLLSLSKKLGTSFFNITNINMIIIIYLQLMIRQHYFFDFYLT